MKPVFKSLVVAGLLASAGFSAFSQNAAPAAGPHAMAAQGGMMHHEGKDGMHRWDPAKMEAMQTKRHAELKAKLKITAAQEAAWAAYTAAMKPAARTMGQHPDRAELEKLSTPERIDKIRSLRTQHMADMTAAMDKRDEATKTFYAALNAEQKKIFDSEHARMGGRHGRDHGPKMDSKADKKAPPAPAAAPKQ